MEVLGHRDFFTRFLVEEQQGVGIVLVAHPINLIGSRVVLAKNGDSLLVDIRGIKLLEEVPWPTAVVHMPIELLQDRVSLYELRTRINVQENSLATAFGCELVTWPKLQGLVGNLLIVLGQVELWEATDLVVVLLSQCLFDNNVEALEKNADESSVSLTQIIHGHLMNFSEGKRKLPPIHVSRCLKLRPVTVRQNSNEQKLFMLS